MIWIKKDLYFLLRNLETKDLAEKDSLGAQKNQFASPQNFGFARRCTAILNTSQNNALRS